MHRLTNAGLSSLLARLYALPLDAGQWQPFLDQFREATGSSLAARISVSGERPQILSGSGEGYSTELQGLYNGRYGPDDPFAAPCLRRLGEDVLPGEELVPKRELMRLEFFDVLLRPLHVEHLTVIPSLLGPGRLEAISLWRSARRGPADEATMETLRLVVPHLRSALHLQERLGVLEERSLLLETMLGSLPEPVFLLDAAGRVSAFNAAAERLAVTGAEVTVCGGRLRLSHTGLQARFEALLAGAFGTDGKGCRPGALAVPRRQDGAPLQVMALPSLPEGTAAASSARAVVFVHDPALRPRPRTELLQALYGLTPTESRVADHLLQGLEMREIAEAMRITLETARFHMKRVMARTGTRRQAELMRLMLMLPG